MPFWIGAVDAHRAHMGEAGTGLPGEIPVGAVLDSYARAQRDVVMTPRLMALRRLVIREVRRFPDLGAHLYRSGPAISLARRAVAIEGYAAQGALALDDPAETAGLFNRMVIGGAVGRATHPGDAGLPSADWCAAQARDCTRVFLAAYGGGSD